MGKKLIIAEKPSLAVDIAKALGVKTGPKDKNKNGSFENDEVIVSPLVGHIIESVYPRAAWTVDNLPVKFDNVSTKVSSGKNDVAKRIKAELLRSDVDEVVNAGDADAEGSLLVYELYEHFNILNSGKKFTRMWMLANDAKTIKASYDTRFNQTDDMKYVNTAKARAEADVKIGFNFSQLFTLKNGKYGETISIGRVMTPTMQIVRRREEEIENFVSEEFYNLKGTFNDSSTELEASLFVLNEEGKQTTAVKTVQYLPLKPQISKGDTYKVSQNETKPEYRKPDYLPNLNDILQNCGKLYNLKSKKVTDIMQTLYEQRYCTYPRSEIKFLPTSIIPDAQNTYNAYTQMYASNIGSNKISFQPKNGRIFNDSKVQEHYAIIPMVKSQSEIDKLDKDHKNVFDYIVSKFLMAFMEDYKYDSSTIVLEKGDVKFKANGKVETQKGFKGYDCASNKTKTEDVVLPSVTVGQDLILNKLAEKKDKTKPPPYLTEPELLKIMGDVHKLYKKQVEEGVEEGEEVQLEFDGNFSLGTPATRGGILDKLFNVKFLSRSGKKVLTTDAGKNLLNLIGDSIDVSMTAKFEEDMANITKEKQKPQDFVAKIDKYIQDIIDKERPNITFVSTSQKTATTSVCPKCSGTLDETQKSFRCENTGKWDSKKKSWDGTCNFSLTKYQKPINYTLTNEDLPKLLSGECIANEKGDKVCLDMDSSYFTKIEYANAKVSTTQTTEVKCPDCGGNILESAKIFRCENTGKWDPKKKKWDGKCGFTHWKNIKVLGRDITGEELGILLTGEKIKDGEKSYQIIKDTSDI